MTKISITIFLVFLYTELIAQQIIPRPIPNQEALPSNEIWTINQDREGYIWLSTSDGLARYDGNEYLVIRNDSNNPRLLPSSNILETVDVGNDIWISTHSGIRLLDKKTYNLRSPLNERVGKEYFLIIVATSSSVWGVSTSGKLYQMTFEGEIQKEYDVKNIFNVDTVNALYVDRNGKLWVLAGFGGLWNYDQNTDGLVRLTDVPEIDYYSICQDHLGRYWIGEWSGGLYKYDQRSRDNQFTRYTVKNQETGTEDVTFFSTIVDNDLHYLWLMSYNKLHCLDISDEKEVRPVYLEDSFNSNEMYTRFLKDREGNLWLSSYGKSMLFHFDNTKIDSYELPVIKEKWGWHTNIVDLCVSDDIIWLAQDRLGLCTYDVKTKAFNCVSTIWNQSLFRSNLRNCVWGYDATSSICRLYNYSNGKVRVDRTIDFRMSASHYNIRQIIEDPNQNLWTFEDNTLIACNRKNEIISKTLNENNICNLCSDGIGNIWLIDTFGNIKKVYLQKDEIVVESLTSEVVSDISFDVLYSTIDDEGCMWAISTVGSVYKSNSQKDYLEQIANVDSLLIGTSPMGLLSKGNYIYFLTRKQLTILNRKDFSSKTFFANDKNIEMAAFGSAIDFDGEDNILVGGQGKFFSLNINTPEYKHWDSNPVVSAIRINDKIVDFSQFKEHSLLELKAGDVNIEISFSNLFYNIQQNPRIAYYLEGIDKTWRELPITSHSAFYNRLPKGKHTLHLKHEYIPDHWADSIEVLTIVQAPYWYETWWAYTLYAIGLLLLTYVLLSTPFEKRKIKDLMTELKHNKMRREVALGGLHAQTELSDSDRDFIEQITRIVEENIKNPDFSVDELAECLCVSRATLHRRMNAVTSMTPLSFIKSKRISKACKLLVADKMSVSEICYEVGFSSPKYFTKCFKECMNMSPKEFVKSQNQEK